MRPEPLSPVSVLRALELFGPQAPPHDFDDQFDCWGLVQKVFDWLDDGYDMDQEALDETTARRWQEIARRDELVPGDLLATHLQPDLEYHVAFYCGRVGGHDLAYYSSPRGSIPVFAPDGGLLADRSVFTRYAGASETTDRPRDDGAPVVSEETVELIWEIADPARDQVTAGVAVIEDAGCLAEGAREVFAHTLRGPATAECRCVVPSASLRAGHSYYWYVMPRNAAGHAAFAPSEGRFTVTGGE